MIEKRFTCLSCPIGCALTARIADDKAVEISGNQCPRGDAYGRQEALEPMRVLPSSVRVVNGTRPLLSVKTDCPIPRRLIVEAMRLICNVSVEAPIAIGEIVLKDILDTGANLVATRGIRRAALPGPVRPCCLK
jgi:CxxC motif-containing protein